MRIVIAYKWAQNPQEALVNQEGVVDWSRAKDAISEFDPVAIEVGRQLADANGAELIGISVGGSSVASTLARKGAMSRGLDRTVLVSEAGLEREGSLKTGRVLASLVERIGEVNLVLTGDSSIDMGAQMVPNVLAGVLGWPAIGQVTRVEGAAGDLRVSRVFKGGTQRIQVSGPAVLAVASDAALPRVPGMKDILAAGKKPCEVVSLGELGVDADPEVELLRAAKPALKARQGRIISGADPEAAVSELVAALRVAGAL